jgi:phosphoglycerate kinase
MTIDDHEMQAWCEMLLAGRKAASTWKLSDYLNTIPGLNSLTDVPAGTKVLVRGDVDAKPGLQVGEGDIRLRSMVQTVTFGRERGWKQIIFGHIGRKPEGSLSKVAARLGELLECEVPLVTDWLNESELKVQEAATHQIDTAAEGSVIMLENTRRYDVERALWKADRNDLPALVPRLARFANHMAEQVARVYVHEALSAGSLDASSTVIPAAMDRVALGDYVAGEFRGPMMRCLDTELVVFSGLKIDKLDDLEAMISGGKIKHVFAAGSLAMALRKAIAELDGQNICIGVAEDSAHNDQPYFIPRGRVAQAKKMVIDGRNRGIEFVVPVDSIVADGTAKLELEPSDQQFDIGPKSTALFEEKIGQFLAEGVEDKVAFYNGVFGMFEDPRFEEGTRKFIRQLKRLTDAGVAVYVGGGEGGKALEKYGEPDWVTHVFTAGGTVLNALGSEPVPYLVALSGAAKKTATCPRNP